MRLDINAAQATFRRSGENPNQEEINKLTDEYKLIQSVANLGQRLGVKGDSITPDSFTFRSLFNEASNNTYFSSATHIGSIERRYGSMYFSIVPRSTLKKAVNGQDYIEFNVVNSGNVYVSTAAIECPSGKITGVNFYKENAVIAARSSDYVFAGVGYGSDGSDNKPLEFIYEEFDRTTKTIVNALRFIRINNKNVILTLQISNDKVIVNTYEIDKSQEAFNNMLNSIEIILKEMNGYNKEASDYGVTNEARINQMSIKYWLNVFRISKYASSKLEATFIKESADSTIPKLSDFEGDNKVMVTRYGNSIGDKFEYFTYDEKVLLNEITEIYSQKLYASSNDDFKQQILCALFNGIYNTFPNKAIIYIPLDFEFSYYRNSNDSWKIYGSISDINVRFINTTITANNLAGYYSNDHILANISGDNRSALYDFHVNYDSNNSDLVYNITVNKLYTLPYINTDNVWVINDQITSIPAHGEDAGNPNIIIVYNKAKGAKDFDILAGAQLSRLKTDISWAPKGAYIQPIETINVDDPQIQTKDDLVLVECVLPNLDSIAENDKQSFIALLRYSLIINVCSVNCFNNVSQEIIDKYGEYGVVTTMWRFNEKTLDFEVVENPSFEDNVRNVALDITAMTNLNNLVKWHIQHTEYKHPDRYSHRWLVFDNANVELKQGVNDFQTYIYPVMLNKNANEYDLNEYKNDLNFYLKYNDAVSGAESEDVRSIGHTNAKYITGAKLAVLNSLYGEKVSNRVTNWKDYTPNVNVPLFNLSEVLTQDINVMNRTNMISFDNTGYMYYSYIGSTFDDDNKNIVHIGGATKNINLGSETMIDNKNRELFKQPTELSLDFKNNWINGFTYISKNLEVKHDTYTFHLNWNVSYTSNKKVYKTNYIPESKFMFQTDKYTSGINYSSPVQFNNNNTIVFKDGKTNEKIIDGQMKRYYEMAADFYKTSTSLNDYRLWIPSFYVYEPEYVSKQHKMIYLGELLYLPGLLCRLGLKQYLNILDEIRLKSNMPIITKYGGVPFMLMTSNRFIKNINYDNISTSTGMATWNINTNELYVGNELAISYYIDEYGNLNLTINELTNNRTFVNNLFKIRLDY